MYSRNKDYFLIFFFNWFNILLRKYQRREIKIKADKLHSRPKNDKRQGNVYNDKEYEKGNGLGMI